MHLSEDGSKGLNMPRSSVDSLQQVNKYVEKWGFGAGEVLSGKIAFPSSMKTGVWIHRTNTKARQVW